MGDMVSSKDIAEAKKLTAHFRQASKKFFDDFYAEAAKAGRFPWPHEAMAALGRILSRAAEEYEEPSQTPHQPGVSADVFEAFLDSRLFEEVYRVACDAHIRHMPGRKKKTPGPKPNVELLEHFLKLHSSKSWREIAKEELQAEPEGEAKDLLIEKERERIRVAAGRARRRSRT
jgi:hypothetical protein